MIEGVSLENISQILENIGTSSENAGKAVGLVNQIRMLLASKDNKSSPAELKATLLDLSEQLLLAQSKNLEVRKQLLELQTAIFEAKRKEDEFARYELWKTPTSDYVYALKDEFSKEETPHFLCPICRQKGIKTILQGETHARCHPCDISYEIRQRSERQRDISGGDAGWMGV